MTKTQSYQELSEQLDDLLARLQHPDIQIDEAVELYEKGLALVEQLETHLKQAENTVEKLKLKAANNG